jgi:hypothetical protein
MSVTAIESDVESADHELSVRVSGHTQLTTALRSTSRGRGNSELAYMTLIDCSSTVYQLTSLGQLHVRLDRE